MDTATMNLLSQSITAWSTRNASLLGEMETKGWSTGLGERLFAELDSLGVLHVLHDLAMPDRLAMVCEIAYTFARQSPSLALLVVQQNMAASLLAQAGAPAPTGWVALPIYDGASEWAHQVRITWQGQALALDGVWSSLPALPIADRALLPIRSGDAVQFALMQINRAKPRGPLTHDKPIQMLGLRGCPHGDLIFSGKKLDDTSILATGDEIEAAMVALWSSAEICMLAIRAAILERSYQTATEYAAVRWQGGKMIIEHSLVRKMLADMHLAKCKFSEAWRTLAGAVTPGEKLTIGQMAALLEMSADLPRLTSDGIQLLGGNGYMEDYGQERLFRDAKQCEMLLGHPQAKRFASWENA